MKNPRILADSGAKSEHLRLLKARFLYPESVDMTTPAGCQNESWRRGRIVGVWNSRFIDLASCSVDTLLYGPRPGQEKKRFDNDTAARQIHRPNECIGITVDSMRSRHP
jgi:hypothetical protein